MSYLYTLLTAVHRAVTVVVIVIVVVVVIVVVPSADCSCLCLALSDQSGGSRPGGLLPCRTAVLFLMSFVWFHQQLSAVRRRSADLLSRRGLLVVEVVMALRVLRLLPQHAILILCGLWKLSGLRGFGVDVFLVMRVVVVVEVVVMVVVAFVVVVVGVIMVARLLVMLHHNSPDAIQPHAL